MDFLALSSSPTKCTLYSLIAPVSYSSWTKAVFLSVRDSISIRNSFSRTLSSFTKACYSVKSRWSYPLTRFSSSISRWSSSMASLHLSKSKSRCCWSTVAPLLRVVLLLSVHPPRPGAKVASGACWRDGVISSVIKSASVCPPSDSLTAWLRLFLSYIIKTKFRTVYSQPAK